LARPLNCNTTNNKNNNNKLGGSPLQMPIPMHRLVIAHGPSVRRRKLHASLQAFTSSCTPCNPSATDRWLAFGPGVEIQPAMSLCPGGDVSTPLLLLKVVVVADSNNNNNSNSYSAKTKLKRRISSAAMNNAMVATDHSSRASDAFSAPAFPPSLSNRGCPFGPDVGFPNASPEGNSTLPKPIKTGGKKLVWIIVLVTSDDLGTAVVQRILILLC
jgi:hypothetical protein